MSHSTNSTTFTAAQPQSFVDLAFAQKQLREVCESAGKAERRFGSHVASALQRRLSDLAAARHADELVAGRPRKLDGDALGQITIEVGDKHTMVLRVNHDPMPLTKQEDIDWPNVSRLILLRIDHHDKH